jgi:hypothetical protein
MQTFEFKEVYGVLPAVLLARAQHIPEEAQVSVVVLKAQGEVTIVGATMVRVIGPLAEIDGDEWSSVAGADEEPKNLLWPLEDVVFFCFSTIHSCCCRMFCEKPANLVSWDINRALPFSCGTCT